MSETRSAPTIESTPRRRSTDSPQEANMRPATRLSYPLLGIEVDALTVPSLKSLLATAIEGNEKRIIAHHNLHSVYLFQRDPQMRAFYDLANHVQIDGMPLIFLGRLFGFGVTRANRLTYLDWRDQLLADAARHGWRIFCLGSKPGVADACAERLRDRFPELQISAAHGYFDIATDSAENLAVLDKIGEYRPHILFVGMGMPRQEQWITENIQRIRANAVFSIGAAFDYEAGASRAAPRWLGRLGLEWLYRLWCEPHRLGRRYLVEPWLILLWMMRELIVETGTLNSDKGQRTP
jgi:N-acetylglucosaminyldiphosphoundecaprenol N-acetyl-beta-D-mannosaminyltransferase